MALKNMLGWVSRLFRRQRVRERHKEQTPLPTQPRSRKRHQHEIDVALTGSRKARIAEITRALETYHSDPEFSDLCFILPAKLLAGCSTNDELKLKILPYQVDILTAELERHLTPFLPYQNHLREREAKRHSFAIFQKGFFRATASTLVSKTMREWGYKPPENPTDIASWMEEMLLDGYTKGQKIPLIELDHFDNRETTKLVRITPGRVLFYPERVGAATSGRNKNCFGVVKTPFYPPDFQRFSKNIEIHIHKEANFVFLPYEEMKLIRRDTDSILKEHGIVIDRMVGSDTPEQEGLWIPEYIK